jgi:MFS transporter, NRE family, putaive nickel resistance protein
MALFLSRLNGISNPSFIRLYLAQVINLAGDSLTWLGLALLAHDLAGPQSGVVLAGALTLRVSTFVVVSPIAGVIADRVDRKGLMVGTHLARMGLVSLLAWVTQIWQLYAVVLSLSLFAACFTPTYTATIPLVTSETERPKAIALSSATYQLLGVLGPGLAGSLAAIVGTRQIFWLDAATFAIAAGLILTLPISLRPQSAPSLSPSVQAYGADLTVGSLCLGRDPLLRYALALQLIAAIAGAEILVNSVGFVQDSLHAGQLEYGWVMAAFGVGATLASLSLGLVRRRLRLAWIMGGGVALMSLALLPAHSAGLGGLLVLWSLAGMGQTFVNLPTQLLIADRVAVELQGRVYGAQFAWSHLWWVGAYPLAGWMGKQGSAYFFYSGLLSTVMLLGVYIVLKPQGLATAPGQWHQHVHHHDGLSHESDAHDHSHDPAAPTTRQDTHSHLHFHGVS